MLDAMQNRHSPTIDRKSDKWTLRGIDIAANSPSRGKNGEKKIRSTPVHCNPNAWTRQTASRRFSTAIGYRASGWREQSVICSSPNTGESALLSRGKRFFHIFVCPCSEILYRVKYKRGARYETFARNFPRKFQYGIP